jgi:hypothetical protein
VSPRRLALFVKGDRRSGPSSRPRPIVLYPGRGGLHWAPALGQLPEILQKHGASTKSQFDAFAEYVEAERNGTDEYPLYEWTKATIADPGKSKSIGSRFLFTWKEGNCNPKTKPMPLRRTFSASWAAV